MSGLWREVIVGTMYEAEARLRLNDFVLLNTGRPTSLSDAG